MISLYLVSSGTAAGKTAIAAGLGKRLLAEGKKIGYLKPDSTGDGRTAFDGSFMKHLLNLAEPVETICPPPDKLTDSLATLSAGKDVMIIEGTIGKTPAQIIKAANARVIIVEDYSSSPVPLETYAEFGPILLGVILNKVPKSRLKRVKGEAEARCEAAGVTLLGVVPEDRFLLSPTVGDIAECIQGKILNNDEKSADLVQNLLVGALSVDSGLLYFGRKASKAAITRVDRPDMQLAVLETPTSCLVITGTATPIYYRVVQKAKTKGVPLVQTELDTNAALANIEDSIGSARFGQARKLTRLDELLQQSIDFKTVYKGIGLAS